MHLRMGSSGRWHHSYDRHPLAGNAGACAGFTVTMVATASASGTMPASALWAWRLTFCATSCSIMLLTYQG